MSLARNAFDAALTDFKKSLTPGEVQDFQFVTLKDVRDTALRIQKDQENLKMLMNMARLESFLEAMNQFGKVIEVFGNANIFVAFVWGPLKFILQTASTWADSFESILDAYSQIGEHMPLLEQYVSLFGTKPHMTRVLALMYADILKFHKKAVRMFRGKSEVWRQLFRSIWKNFDTQFKGLLEGLKLHRQLIAEQAELSHFEDSQTNSQAILAHIQQYERDRLEKWDRLKKQEQNERERQYLATLDWFSAAQSTTADHESFRNIRAPYTGSENWILKDEKIQNWREMDTPVSSILWMNGIPGAGKTILASVIIDSCLQDTSYITGYFYCQEGDPEKNDCISILRGLLAQLLNHSRDLIPYCYEKYLSSGEVNLTSPALAERLLKLCFERIPRQFIIIDGLDECIPSQRKLVLSFFTSVVDKCDEREPGKLRVLFVSQNFPDIGKALQTADVMKLTPADNKNDIKSYVRQWSEKIKEKYSLNKEQIEFIQESTLIRSQGMFLFAKLVMENLHAQETRIDLLTEIEVYPFPQGLGDAYERILRRLERSMAPKQWYIVLKLLGWMVCAKRPLKWREIQAAVSIDPDEQTVDFDSRRLRSSVEEYCGSLIQVLSGDRVELVHNTAKIYMTESKHIQPSAVECNLASLCLRYLTFQCFDDEIDSDDLELFTTNGFLSFQDYASAKWLQHIRAVIQMSTATFFSDGESQRALQDLELGLEEFSSRYEQDMTQGPIPKEVEEACEPFKAYLFHTSLVCVWNHIYEHDLKGPEARKKISLQCLGKSLLRNRALLESLSSSTSSKAITIFHGDKHFKCPRPTCFYFHEGFKNASSRDQHINRHDRPFSCAFPDCSIAEFGFSSNKDLEKHRKLFHPQTADQANAFQGKVNPTAATPWGCDLCDKRFTRSFHQRNHLRSHAGERPFKCGDCGKAFTRSNDCKRHEKLHTRR
ncbi:Vegetative incompatibility HET-E-1 [Hyphodiscus hymeniophilus]|uniref:Vegetative incompatibility HET-E-1 n=1 Tax=Hyphodiscus hymeniophilus TaxID=353542 RepID=A0A9P6VJC0_9HELO|nr:Vegetative incompatibility HET-E-1 [Hyphodiscus hymeniophilus]